MPKKIFFKPKQEVSMEQIKSALEKNFPDLEYSMSGKKGKENLTIKKSTFGGALVFFSLGRLFVKGEAPTFIGGLIDTFTMGIISDITNKKLVLNVLAHLKGEFGHMDSLK